jgi:hypothetical protein
MRRAVYRLLIAASLLPFSSPAPAAPAQVTGVQPPAWVEHAGQRIALRAGATLEATDVLETGKGGRLQVALADGSTLKVGENARVALKELDIPATGGTMRGFLDVLRGAFRFTTAAAQKALRRDVDVRIASVIVGIRGTDIWGRSNSEADLVCLIEGDISVEHPAAGRLAMREPLTFFVAPKNAPPKPIGLVAPDKLALWAAETEFERGGGLLLPDGGWAVQLGVHVDVQQAERMARRLRDAGYPVELEAAETGGRRYQRVRLVGFDTQADAKAFAKRIAGRHGVARPRVTPRQ